MPIPKPIKELYGRTELLIKQDVVFCDQNDREWHVAEFSPADLKTLDDAWSDLKEGNNFPFASDSFGDRYYIDLTNNEEPHRCPVMLYHHDGGDVEVVAASLGEFLGWYRGR